MAVTVVSYPNNDINESFATDASFSSADLISYVWVNIEEIITDTYIEVVYNSQTITLLLQEECRYEPVNIVFQNKEGAEQTLQFFKARTDTLTTTSSEFESDRGQPSLGNHQFVKFNVQGRTKFKVNTGFVNESNNESFKQLFLSKQIWWLKNDGTLSAVPLNIESKSLEYKTRANDRLINYEVEFSFAFNEINSI
jgi:hypothetical protein